MKILSKWNLDKIVGLQSRFTYKLYKIQMLLKNYLISKQTL